MNQNKKTYPKISIVTPNFNKDKYLEATILSVLSQNYPNLEYIIMDGGSTDSSLDIIRKYESQLAYWVSEKDKGMYDAIKKGFEHSTGEIMGWINSDDILYPHSLFVLAELFNSFPQTNWLTGLSSHIDEEGKTIWVSISRHFNRIDFLTGDFKFIQQESTYWRRGLYERAGGLDNTLKLAGDFSLWLHFIRTDKLYVANVPIGGFRVSREGQLSENLKSYLNEAYKVLEREPISETEKQMIKTRRNKIRWSVFLKKLKFFNTERFENWLYKEERNEIYFSTFLYDRKKQQFFLPEKKN